MTRSTSNIWLHRFAVLTAAATLFLIWVGGLVTSHGAGMAVPDWPTTYGYNMFLFPISQWKGGIFFEHSHRLVASGIGLFTVILAVWLWLKESRLWLRRLGVVAVVLVIAQGILGGLRVTAMKDEIGVFHATLAQLFLVLLSAMALFTSRWWTGGSWKPLVTQGARSVRLWALGISGLILVQLVVAAAMRHQHAGLAIPDFPAAYGRVWPATDPESIARYNQQRGEVVATNPITAGQIHLQMTHRLLALLIVAGVMTAALQARRHGRGIALIRRLAHLWMALIVVQALLGAATIWTNKAADVATAHVACGALSFVTGALLFLAAKRALIEPAGVRSRSAANALGTLAPEAAKA